MPRGYGNLFPGGAGKRDQSRGGGLSLRAAQEECHYPVFLGDREEATLQLAEYLFPCLAACVNPGSKLSRALAAGIAGKYYAEVKKSFVCAFIVFEDFEGSRFTEEPPLL